MQKFLDSIVQTLERGTALAHAVILTSDGSAPRTAGARMLVSEQGIVAGTIGGGLLEGQILEAATRVLDSGQPEQQDFDLSGDLAAGADMICGGRIRVAVSRLSPEEAPAFRLLADGLRSGQVCITATPIRKGGHRLFRVGDRLFSGQGQALDEKTASVLCRELPTGYPVLVSDLADDFCLEPWQVSPRLILAGGGHVSLATAQVAVVAGFEVTVLDDRPEFATPERFPMAAQVKVCPNFVDCYRGIVMDGNTYVVILTRGHSHDATALEQALRASRHCTLAYVGMIGSVRKRDAIYERMRRVGVTEAELERVHCPVGLPIEAETPGEIAVSIVAQCVAQRRRLETGQTHLERFLFAGFHEGLPFACSLTSCPGRAKLCGYAMYKENSHGSQEN